jgi:flagellar biosynthetic protein FlhB
MMTEKDNMLFLRILPGEPGLLRFDLQMFAAEDEGRTEEPTEKKLREAREKGQVAKTQEFTQGLVIIFGFVILIFLGAWIYDSMAKLTKYYITTFSRFSLTERSIFMEFLRMGIESAKVLAPIFAAVVVAAILGDAAQVGFQVSMHPIKFDLNKIKFDPATMFRKVFFSRQIAANLVKSVVKVIAIGMVAYIVIINNFDDLMKTPDISVAMSVRIVAIIAVKIILWSAVLMLVIALPDYLFQKREFIESLKMTKEEVKEEWKETVGDPHIRARLREMQREIVMKNMIKEVPRADVVITNPTHFAVALRYDNLSMDAPQVTAKGVDSMALRIRQIAKDHNVYMVENRPLAQELYKRLEVGDMIPDDLFYAVSLVYAELYRVRGYTFSEAI